MYRHKPSAVCWATLIILVVSLVVEPAVARAQDGPRYWAGGGLLGPIGTLWSNGQVRMNGRLVGGAQPVWSGDLLEAVSGASHQVFIRSVGQAGLMSNARVRLSLGSAGDDGQAARPLLVAALIEGDLALRLDEDAGAYVEACGQGFVSSAGAVFRIGIRDGQPFVVTERGRVEPASSDFRRIISVGLPSLIDRKTNSTKVAHGRTPVPKGQQQTCLVELRWMEKPGGPRLVQASWVGGLSIPQAQGDWQPAVGVPVAFRLTNPIGTLNGQSDVTVLTDAAGIARVTFTALKSGSTTLIGKVQAAPDDTCEPSDEVRWEIGVPGVLSRTKWIIIGAAVATAATYPIWKPEKKIKQIPPVEIIP